MTGDSVDSYRIAVNQVLEWYNGDKVSLRGLANLTNGDDYTIRRFRSHRNDRQNK